MDKSNIFDPELYLIDLKSKFQKINPEEYYLSYSGGKDSHFLYWFIKEYLQDNKIKVVACNTYMEYPEIRDRMYKYADIILYPSKKPFEIKEKYGIPCFSKNQDMFIKRYQNGSRSYNTLKFVKGEEKSMFNLNKTASNLLLNDKLHQISPKCCDFLKKQPFEEYKKISGLKPILGVRQSESILRQKSYKNCFKKDGTFTPLYDLDDKLLNEIYETYNIELPNIYKHISRTGCVGCPYGRQIEKELSLVSENQRKFAINYFKESYDVLKINYKQIYRQLNLFEGREQYDK